MTMIGPSIAVGGQQNRVGALGGASPPAPPMPAEIGDMFNGTGAEFYAACDLTNNTPGVSIAPVGNDLVVSGTAGGNLFQDWLKMKSSVSPHVIGVNEKWYYEYLITTTAINGTSYGQSWGWLSQSANEKIDFFARPVFDTALLGRTSVYMGDVRANGISTQRAVTLPGYAVTGTTTYLIRIERDVFTTTISWYDQTGMTLLNSGTFIHTISNNNHFYHNTGSPVMFHHGGSFTIHSVRMYIKARRYVTTAGIGDSICYGAWQSSIANRYMQQLTAKGSGTCDVFAGPADTSADVYARRSQIVDIQAQNILINILSNDIAFGVPSGTWQANMNNLRAYLLANTTALIHWCIPAARNDANVTPAETFLLGWTLDPARERRINLFQSTKQGGGTGLLGTYNEGDGVHHNDAGATKCADDIYAISPEVAG